MNPAKQISPPGWMLDPRTARVMAALGGDLPEPQSLFVGGAVRNELLGEAVEDIDIATRHTPMAVIERLSEAGIRYVPTGLEHGTITAVLDGASFQITTLRRDLDTDGRHAVIAFSDSWREDAERRDFTMNTLLASMRGVVFDPTGHGLEDLEAGRVVFVGNAERRICEDYLRIMRFFRFHAKYGRGDPDAETLAACRTHADKVGKLSRERVTQEMMRIMEYRAPQASVTPMFATGVLPALGEYYNPKALERVCDLQAEHSLPDVMARFAIVAALDVERLEAAFTFSNAQKQHLERLSHCANSFVRPTRKQVRRAVYRDGNRVAPQALFLAAAMANAAVNADNLDVARYWQAPVFPIKAQSLIDTGTLRGPELGRRLREIEEAWIASDFRKLPDV